MCRFMGSNKPNHTMVQYEMGMQPFSQPILIPKPDQNITNVFMLLQDRREREDTETKFI